MKKLTIALAASICVMNAMAIEGPYAFVPSNVGATFPGTAVPATAWKLVGSLGGSGGASGVQITSRWVLTAAHVAGSLAIGSPFTNAYGTATVDAKYLATSASLPAGVNAADLALVHLSSDLYVPPAELPALLADQLGADANNLPGQMLAAGRGGFSVVKAHWLPANDDISPQTALTPSGVYAIVGDSGSGVFWYPTAASRPVLRSITTSAGNPVGPTEEQVGTSSKATVFDARSWVNATISGAGGAGDLPLWTTSLVQAPLATRTPNLAESPQVKQTSATGANVTWAAPKPSASGVPSTSGYLVRISPGGAQYNLAADASSLNINGLAPNTTYSATVQAVNANGPSGTRWAIASLDMASADKTKFVTAIAPNALASLAYETYTTTNNGQLAGCVRFNPVYAATGAVANAFVVSNYAFSNPVQPLPTTPSVDYCALKPGVPATLFAAPWNRLSNGPAKTISVTPPSALSGVPLNLTAKGVVISDSDGSGVYLTAKWGKPNPPQPVATLNGYQMAVRCNNAAGLPSTSLTFGLAANVTNWTVSNVPSGGVCTVFITAQWSRAIPYNSVVTTVPMPVL